LLYGFFPFSIHRIEYVHKAQDGCTALFLN
jgi:hypothetical protein